MHSWYIRDETYASALAVLTNAQLAREFAQYWGDGTTSSSDGQRFKAGNLEPKHSGNINPKYGSEPGRLIYTYISDNGHHLVMKSMSDSKIRIYILNGCYHHKSGKVEEHYTDTAGFTDHVFALMHLLGFRLPLVFAILKKPSCLCHLVKIVIRC